MSRQYISVLSTFSTDRLINAQGDELALQAGGPALFIERALKEVGQPYKLDYGKPIAVEILLTKDGEFGRATQSPQQQTSTPMSDWTIVSTILDEWQVGEPLPSKLFVDLQGYVRDGKDFGKKQSSPLINRLAGKTFCLKGTKEEVSYLSKAALERQKQNLLVVTNGGEGVDLYYKGQYKYLPVKMVDGLSNTIGAGDTFFAYFAALMFRGNTPVDAALYAIERTNQFLKMKLPEVNT